MWGVWVAAAPPQPPPPGLAPASKPSTPPSQPASRPASAALPPKPATPPASASKPASRPASAAPPAKPSSPPARPLSARPVSAPKSAPVAARAASNSEDPLAASRLGITLRGLRRLFARLRERFGADQLAGMSTSELMRAYVLPATEARRCRLLELAPEEVDPEDVAPPKYFISHAWMNRAQRLFEYVLGFLQDAEDGVSVWIDILAVNQHAGTQAQLHDVSPEAFSATVQACSAGTLVVLDREACSPATRAWCIFEWTHTLTLHGPDGLHMFLRPADRSQLFHSIDVEAAQCFLQSDKDMILGEVVKHHSSPKAFNSKLKLQLLLEPLSYAVDMRRLTEQAAATGTVWEWGPVDAWLAGGGAGGSRVLCLAAGAGEGKSTAAAALCGRLAGDAGGAGGAPGGVVSAHHFVKYNDARRLEPVRVIKSLAYQLAERLPSVSQMLLSLDVAGVATLADSEDAFEQLLRRPLAAHFAAEDAAPVVLLLDALDEADPPELLRGGGGAAAAGGGAAGKAGAGRVPCPTGHPDKVLCVAYSPDGRQLASVGEDDAVLRVWDARTGRPTAALLGHSDGRTLRCVAFSPDGRRLASGGDDGTVLLWDAATGQPTATLDCGGERVYGLAFSPDGSLLVTGDGGGAVRVWEVGSGECGMALEGHSDTVRCVAWSHDGQQIASGGEDYVVRVWHAESGVCMSKIEDVFDDDVNAVAFSADDLTLVTASSDGKVLRYDLATQELETVMELGGGEVKALAFSPDGRILASADQQVRLWDAEEWDYAGDLQGGSGYMQSVAFSPDGRQLAVGRSDATIRIWDVPGSGGAAAGRRRSSATGGPGGGGRDKGEVREAVRNMAFSSPDGERLASGGRDGLVRVWDSRSGLLVATLEGHAGAVHSVAFSPVSRGQLASVGKDGSVRLWQTAGGGPRCTANWTGHTGAVRCVAFSPDGKWLASGGTDAKVRVWEIEIEHCATTLRGHVGDVTAVAFSPDSRAVASCGIDKSVRVWDAGSGECRAVLSGHTGDVHALAFSPVAELLVTGGEDKVMRVWDVTRGSLLVGLLADVKAAPTMEELNARGDFAFNAIQEASAAPFRGIIYGLAFSPDGKQLASANNDDVVRIWDTAAWKCVASLPGHVETLGGVMCVAYSPDGKQLASSGADQTVRLWKR
ncbi:hypothetical protein GPECTOR_8g39 [Gonium pectorale]|uniref:Nephrocystin 3-like N-terminal domain-containing protein n=1 Tax=Gonium pectorale TaxID=33097 RepID=A0A150GTH2_GONPE|nr:hypothetical protein GPECTOR_8g39 [Gonium pectorale]|eukprot:KXZ53022.1 hypothetical protein GPECTOR_8g39 [Gonium pectorale]